VLFWKYLCDHIRAIENILSWYSAAKFTIFHVNSREFTNFHTFHEIFFLPVYGRQTRLKIVSHGLFHKKSFMFSIRGGNMDCFEYERFFVKKPMRGYFSSLDFFKDVLINLYVYWILPPNNQPKHKTHKKLSTIPWLILSWFLK
jgi:hypothetical protein